MTKPLRLVIVTRRFWPLVGAPEKALARLAGGLASCGCSVTIVTFRWEPHWPAEIRFHEVPVVRISPCPGGGWKTWRATRALKRWLRARQHDFDVAYVSMLQYEAEATIKAVGARVPVVLRAERGGRWGDCLWQIDARGGRRIKHACTAAASFVAPTPPVTRELEAAGYARPRIRQVLNGMVPSPPRTAESRNAARAALADAHAMLKLSEWATLALSTGRIERARGIEHLVAAWPAIARQWAGARLWLAGEAPERAALVRQTDSLGLSSRIVPVGVFDDVDALMAAADLFISPAPEGSPNGILEAMAAALPVVALDVPNNRWLVEDGRSGLLVPPGDVPGLAAAIARLAGDARLRSQFGAAGRERVAREFALERMVQEHLALFCDVRDSVSKK